MVVFGVTGGVAAGKTTVAGELERLGARSLNADRMAHELLRPGSSVFDAVVSEFGRGVLGPDGRIDRRALARVVFPAVESGGGGPSPQLLRLQELLHPPVLQRCRRELDRFRAEGARAAVIDAPLLIEAGMEGMVDCLIVVTASEKTQLGRAKERSGLGPGQARARMRAQMTLAEKAARADYVIDGESPLEQMRARVREIWNEQVGA